MTNSANSKFLSFVLRHKPEEIGIVLDAGGWVRIADLCVGLERAGRSMTEEEVFELVARSDKQRFTLSHDRSRIRAAQGHSVKVDLGLAPAEPPHVLFHGTASGSVASILKTGLHAGQRQHVHLSENKETATRVGSRHGQPVVLQVLAAAMHQEDYQFFQADNGVWLTEAVPAEYLRKNE